MAREPQWTGRPLNPEEYGFVMGGPVRAAEVAIAALIERGVLRVNRDGGLSSTGQPHGLTRLEAEVVHAVGADVAPVPTVIAAVTRSTAVAAIADALRERGIGRPSRNPLRRLRRAQPLARTLVHDRLSAAGLVPLAMMGTVPAIVAMDGLGAYPDDELSPALLAARGAAAGYASCSYAWAGSDDGSAHSTSWVGCGSGSGTFMSCGGGGSCGGGSSCGGSCGGGGGCGGGGCGGGGGGS